MKKLSIIYLLILTVVFVNAQQTTNVGMMGKNVVTVEEGADKTNVKIGKNIEVTDDYTNDTTKIRFGKRELVVVESDNDTQVNIKKSSGWDEDDDKEFNDYHKFNGHWSGLDIGVNGFYDTDYSMYGGNEFMELNQPKSLEVNLNFLEYSISLQKNKGNIGLVTGMGLSYNNYKFENLYTIDKIDDMIEPVAIDGSNLKRNKLTVSYLTVPLMLEFQIPVNNRTDRLFISGGVLGGINLGSHTKIKWSHEKDKDKGSFNINPFKYAAIARIGSNHISLYATYNFSPLFKDAKGPELTPFSIGISFINF